MAIDREAGMKRRHLRSRVAALAAGLGCTLLLSACISSGGIHTRESMIDPASLDPGAAIRAAESDAKWPDSDWWRQWNDPQLNTLVQDATAGNPGLRAVQARIDTARFQAQIAGADELPQLDAGGTFERSRFARYDTPAPPGGTKQCQPPAIGQAYEVQVRLIDRPTRSTATIAWSDSTACSYGDQIWRWSRARAAGVCAMSGRAILPGDAIYKPRTCRPMPLNAQAMILGVVLDEVTALA
jgi:hypothetical protein